MSEEETENGTALAGIVFEGLWTRLRFAFRVLFYGNAVIAFDVEEFLEKMLADAAGRTTCVYTGDDGEDRVVASAGPARAAWQEVLDAEAEASDHEFAKQIGHGD